MEFKNVCVIGEREAVLGFKLIGIRDVFEAEPGKAAQMLQQLISKDYNLIIATESVRRELKSSDLRSIEVMLKPIVIFISTPGETEIESVESMAKRILGIKIGNKSN
jgi:V/A-type H+-transporting ATPase subunit F